MRKRNGAPWLAWAHRIILGSPRSCWRGEQKQRPDNESNVTSYFLSRAHLPGNYLALSLASGSPPSATSLDDVSIFHPVFIEAQKTQNKAPKRSLSPSPPPCSPTPCCHSWHHEWGCSCLSRQKALTGKGGHTEEKKCTASNIRSN